MINSRALSDLHPYVSKLCQQFIDNCQAQGMKVLITSTLRDNESQSALYAQGRTISGNIVTNAKAGQSIHNYGLAFDFVPLVNNKPDWNNLTLFKQCAEIGKLLGLEWGGDWISFKDFPHLQYTEGLTLHDLQNGKTITKAI